MYYVTNILGIFDTHLR